MAGEEIVSNFFIDISNRLQILHENKKIFDLANAYDFNPFYFWYYHNNENKISEILSYFLNPEEKHGQGNTFIRYFLNQMGFDNTVLEGAEFTVKVESPTTKIENSKRRMDILIEEHKNGERHGIVIENKIYDWTKDQVDQIHDYWKHLHNQYGPDNSKIIYLTPSGKEPDERSIPKEDLKKLKNFKLLSYAELAGIIHQFSLLSEALNVRTFLKHFEDYIKKEILGEYSMADIEMIKNKLIDNVGYFEVARLASQVINEVKKSKIEDFNKKIASINGVDFSEDLYKEDFNKNYILYKFSNSIEKKIELTIELGGTCYYGLVTNDSPDSDLYIKLKNISENDSSGCEKSENNWPWWKKFKDEFYKFNDENSEFWKAIYNGEMENYFKEIIQEMLGVLKKLNL